MATPGGPLILSTWSFGQRANRAAWDTLLSGDTLGAVEAGARDAERDPDNRTVGRGGYPDAAGRVSLDAAVMLSPARHGAVACVRDVLHPVSLARLVMERTPHRLLVGDGAEAFARECGMAPADLMTDEARSAWTRWKSSGEPLRLANLEDRSEEREGRVSGGRRDGGFDANTAGLKSQISNLRSEISGSTSAISDANHDTIGLVALSAAGQLAAACSTSGLAYKRAGRVGDSPIVGAGLYCEPGVGAAVCTGRGELVQGTLASYVAVDALRRGDPPDVAVRHVLERIAGVHRLGDDDQVGVIVVGASGEWSSGSLRPGFAVAVRSERVDDVVEPQIVLTREAR